jgi:hypothetical protein
MRGTSSSHTVQPKAKRASKPVHIPAAIGTCRAPNRQRDDAPVAPEPSTRVSVHTHRHLPTKRQKPQTSTRHRMGPLATEPPKPRPTKHAHRHNPLRRVHRLYRPPAIHPRGTLAIGSQRPHFNHERHRKTPVHQPNPQTHNPASQIHSVTTWTGTEARWHLEENPPPIIAKRALSQRLYTPSVGDTHVHAIRRRRSHRTGLRARSSLNQTRPRRRISPHPGTPRRLVATRIRLDGNMVVRPVPPFRLPHIASHLRSLRISLGMDHPNPTGLGAYTPLP